MHATRSRLRRLAIASSFVATTVASNGAWSAEPIRTLDLRADFDVASTDVTQRRAAYDDLVAATCLQGIVNRTAPRMYLFYVKSVVDGSIDTDQLWFDRLKDPAIGASVVSGRTVEAVPTIEAAIDAYSSYVKGLVIWDEKVPATVNAAFAAAAAEDLLAVRWDSSPTSLHQRLLAKGLIAKVSLVNADGSSRFLDKQGTADVPDLTRQTSQSAKADAYVWALEKYLKPKLLDGRELGWMLDAHWLLDPHDYGGTAQATNQLQITNHDFLVARKGMAFDLSPWSDVAATDDPGQPIGTDVAVLDEIVAAARAAAGDDAITVRGFFAWQFKYTTLEGLPAGHEPVMGEWTSVKRISKQAAGLDADAPGIATMANASFFQHVPLDEVPEPQKRPTPEDLVGQGFLSGLAPNGGFEDGESSWTMHVTNHIAYEDPRTGAPRSHSGLRYLECNTTALGDDLQDNLFRDGPGVAVGQHATLRAFVRAPAGAVDGELAIWGLGGANEQMSTKFTAGADWTEVRATLDVKQAGHTSTRAQIYLRTGAGTNLDVDDVAFYAGDAAAASVEPATYALWYLGDYDAAAWIYEFSPVTWDGAGRGLVPFAWDFSAHVATRFPPFFRHALRTRTPRDFFVGADSGPGYGNPSQMDGPARAIWAKAGAHDARVLDTSMGWVLDPLATLDATHLGAVTPFFGDGVLLTGSGPSIVNKDVEHAPVVSLDNFGGTDVPSGTAWMLGAVPTSPAAPAFRAFRAVLWKSGDLVAMTHDVSVGHADRKVRFVDPYEFSALARLSFGERTTHRASYRDVVWPRPATTGAKVHVSLVVHNDGFDTWHATGANPYRVGFDLRDVAPAPRALPPDAGAYPTRVSLAADVPPGGEATIVADLPAIATTGYRVLQVDVVEEGVTWFETTGDLPLQVGVDLVAPVADAGPSDASLPDATPSDDGATGDDASRDATDNDATPGDDGGGSSACGCNDVGRKDPSGWPVLVLAAWIFGRSRRRRGATLVGLCAVLACRAETIDEPVAPTMDDVLAAFTAPNGTLDSTTSIEARAFVEEAIKGLIGAGVPQLVYDTVAKAAQDTEAKNGSKSARNERFGPALGTESFDGDGFAQLTHICDGWGATRTPDDATNGHLSLTLGFDETALDPIVWGTTERCRYLPSGARLLLDRGSSPNDLRVYLGEGTTVSELGTLPVVVALDVKAAIDDVPVAPKLAVRFVPGTSELEMLVPISSGTLVVSLSANDVVRVRAKNGTFTCVAATHQCTNETGTEVTL